MSEAYAILGDDRKRYLLRSRYSFSLHLFIPFPGVNTTALLVPPITLSIRQGNILKRRPPVPLSNLALNTFGPTIPETAREIQWVVIPTLHAMTTSTNTHVREIICMTILSRDHTDRIQGQARIHFQTHSCRMRRVIVDLSLALPRGRVVPNRIFSEVDFRVHALHPGLHQVEREGVVRQLMVIRHQTKLQQRVG